MNYTELPINQKINAKNNAMVCWGDKVRQIFRRRNDSSWNCEMYSPEKLRLEKPGIHNNRNYDGPSDPYSSGFLPGELESRMISYQRIK